MVLVMSFVLIIYNRMCGLLYHFEWYIYILLVHASIVRAFTDVKCCNCSNSQVFYVLFFPVK
jgi:hypothetical protein